MEDFNSETDSDYTSYWRDWNEERLSCAYPAHPAESGLWPSVSLLPRRFSKVSVSSTQTQRAGSCLADQTRGIMSAT
ncbi:uncharacterized protein N7487_003129 [Penicillium crustosum]|uniref:uncharacterized protein n=1 Tax=Penicillium crustosum TaxID=36656 RepID=UPI002393951A|nr:uncharacterized protein N7487_003129 [Penicillium crustosum]KAJ5419579.1 hypothetical protein N7487_003129 [Penicillium crustosum]